MKFLTFTKRITLIALLVICSFFVKEYVSASNPPGYVSDYTRGTQKILVVPVSTVSRPQQGTVGYLNHILFDTSNQYSLASYYESVSGGTLHFEGQVVGPVDNPITTTDARGCELWPNDLLSLIPNNIDITEFSQIIFMKGCGESTGGGYVEVEDTDGSIHVVHVSTVHSYMNNIVPDSGQPLANDPNQLGFVHVFIHELGHSLSFPHEHGVQCGSLGFEKIDQCSFEEYGSFSVMGIGVRGKENPINIAAASGVGWILNSQELKNPAPGNYNIFARSGTGIKHLKFDSQNVLPKFPLGKQALSDNFPQSYISAEFRPSFPTWPGGARWNLGLLNSTPGVSFVSYIDRGEFYSQQNWPSVGEGLVVTRELPGDWYQKGWSTNVFVAGGREYPTGDEENSLFGAGTGFYDYYAKRGINVNQIFSDRASVQVVQDPQACTRTTPNFSFVSATPLSSSAGRDNITMSYSVTNRDSTGCGASNFTLETYQASPYPSTYEGTHGGTGPLSGMRNANDWQAQTPTTISGLQPNETRTVTINLSATTGQWRYGAAQFRLKNNSVLGVARTWEDPVGVQPLAGCTQKRPQVTFLQPAYSQTNISNLTIQVKVKNMDTGNCPSSNVFVNFYPLLGSGYTVFGQGQPSPIYPYPPVNLTISAGQEQTITRVLPVQNIPGTSPFSTGIYARASKQPLGTLPYGPSSYPFVSVGSALYAYNPSNTPALVRITSPADQAVVSATNNTLVSVNGSSALGIQSIKLENQTQGYTNTISLPNPSVTTQVFSVPPSAIVSGQNTLMATLTELGGRQVFNYITVFRDNQCPADYNHDGAMTPQDIFDFLNSWFSANIAADFNHSNELEPADIFDFLNSWFVGCTTTVPAPPAPALSAPINQYQTNNSAQITFSWQPITTHPNPISYFFTIATNQNFTPTSIVYDRSWNMTTFQPNIQLPPGTYYWRVIAADTTNYNNLSAYNTRSFIVTQ